MPDATIGLTTYNAEAFLEATLRSLLAQSGCDFRLVVSDDASTDGTDRICRTWASKDPRIEYHRQEVNLGPRRNFRFVFDRCRTPYFMWASHDDLWSPNFLSACRAELEAQPDAGFAITPWIVESRTIPFLRRMNLPSMAFVADPDPLRRMLAYTVLPDASFKDNLTYGVWRREALGRILDDLEGLTTYFSIGGAANVYTLLRCRGCYAEGARLRKRYRWAPPGSLFEPLFRAASCLRRGGNPGPLYPPFTLADHLRDLDVVCRLAGLDEATCERILKVAARDRIVRAGVPPR